MKVDQFNKRILITGGAGFIGSHVVKYFVHQHPEIFVVNCDLLTYAGNLSNLKEIETAPNYGFEKQDIRDLNAIQTVFNQYKITDVIHLAAESHVDRSIESPTDFISTNVLGTVNLLLAAKEYWKNSMNSHRFYHVSTDEVYGSLGETGKFTETTSYDPRSPYSASKASSDHLVRAFHHTYQLPIVISNCSNNYGPYQFPEKLIPLMINNILHQKELPVYGQGLNVRDWLWVGDHVSAIHRIFFNGQDGETYNIGGNCEMKNIDLVNLLCQIVDSALNRPDGSSKQLIRYVKDRAGHDLRYAIDASKIKEKLSWEPSMDLEQGLKITVDWYLQNTEWLNQIVNGEYQNYYQRHYSKRNELQY
ncbi:MAG TPA: dTDP-glucose 4,6-dehydratase [Saprospiraceae bacterium]|nr:dTDP-glucose 4,6-dehydratase [Saprospiraceae bacterium]